MSQDDPREPRTPPSAQADQSTSTERVSDGRNREPGVHPTVERTGRSPAIVIALAVALVVAALMFLAIVIGIINPW